MSLMGNKDLKGTVPYIRAVQLQKMCVLRILVTNLPHKRYGRQRWQP